MNIHCFVVNPFSENSYIFWDDPTKAVLIDPGFYTTEENAECIAFIEDNKLIISEIILTHAHIDHVFGLEFLHQKWGISPRLHPKELLVYQSAAQVSQMYGIKIFKYPTPMIDMEEGKNRMIGGIQFDVLFTPGHSPGSVSYFAPDHGVVFSGDALFEGSIGRTDLPGGDYDTLIKSIKSELMTLPNSTKVYSGHGGITNIGQEKLSNPFLH
ncbi:MAG: MBL fold metallo-hydrolase [Saprospiraceae bacterium]|nr:MBL fold metallo-hydrolase [Saprospiraceae bacterium]MBK9630264.1 MBL fold metallo-hydrolase [Saprospiraceae bacterium]